MPRSQKGPLVLGQLRKGVLFKVMEPVQVDAGLTLEGVYQVATAKANHSRTVKVFDLAGLRKAGTILSYTRIITIPSEAAKDIRVFTLP